MNYFRFAFNLFCNCFVLFCFSKFPSCRRANENTHMYGPDLLVRYRVLVLASMRQLTPINQVHWRDDSKMRTMTIQFLVSSHTWWILRAIKYAPRKGLSTDFALQLDNVMSGCDGFLWIAPWGCLQFTKFFMFFIFVQYQYLASTYHSSSLKLEFKFIANLLQINANSSTQLKNNTQNNQIKFMFNLMNLCHVR